MANFNELLEKVYEINDGDLVTESVLSPVRKFKDKLKKIKDEKPTEYSDNSEIRDFIDKSYDTIDDVAKILEKEPKELRKKEINAGITFCITYIGGFILLAAGAPFGGGAFLFSGFGLMILSIVITLVHSIIEYIRANDDKDAYNDLQKIRNALKKVQNKKIPESYKKKISDLITSIDDASEEISTRIKVKESVDNIKLEIYESCYEGEITTGERDELLEMMNSVNGEEMTEGVLSNIKNKLSKKKDPVVSDAKNKMNSATSSIKDLVNDNNKDKDMLNDARQKLLDAKAKMTKTDLKLAVHESCYAGEITAEERDELLSLLQ